MLHVFIILSVRFDENSICHNIQLRMYDFATKSNFARPIISVAAPNITFLVSLFYLCMPAKSISYLFLDAEPRIRLIDHFLLFFYLFKHMELL